MFEKLRVTYCYREFLISTHITVRTMENLLQVAVRSKEVCCKSQFTLQSQRRCETKLNQELLLAGTNLSSFTPLKADVQRK